MTTHDQRLQAIRDGFARANGAMASQIEQLDDRKAASAPPAGWSAAQIAWHVAQTTEFLSGALSGAQASMLVPRPDGFQEVLATMELPSKIKTFPALEPPAGVSRADGVQRLRSSQDTLFSALKSVTPERCAAQCVQLPFGAFSLYEVGEFAGAHVLRHAGQLERTLAAV